ncbi:MAG: sensor histidine kinase [Gemmatimonadaceae bacterium]
MTLRARLILGLLNITVLLLLPLSIALRGIDELHETARSLRSNEFVASLLLGRIRTQSDAVRSAELSLVLVPNDTTALAFTAQIDTLRRLADSLPVLFADSSARQIGAAVDSIAALAPVEASLANGVQTRAIDSVSDGFMRPALGRMQRTITEAEGALTRRIAAQVDEATAATENAWQTAGTTFAIALVLVTVVAVWLTRTISRPVRDLERGMKKVASGEFGHRLAIAPDRRDEFGRLAASYQSMALQLAELDKLKAEFVSVASHEIKTPLNVILGYLQLLQEGVYGDLTSRQREVLETLESQCDALNRLVKQLLDVSRFEAGGGKLEPRTVTLSLFLRELESAFQVLALQRGITFIVARDGVLPTTVYWDEDRMNEVLGNLLSNAFKFTDRGGRVELSVAAVPEGLRMEVRDSGAGIAPNQLPHIFEKFYQADNQSAAAAKGTGLGLAIAKEIVEAHGGEIAVRSAPREGTTFTITLPLEAPSGWRRTPRRARAVTAAAR